MFFSFCAPLPRPSMLLNDSSVTSYTDQTALRKTKKIVPLQIYLTAK